MNEAILVRAVRTLLQRDVRSLNVQMTPLQGGTLGDVQRIVGTAETAEGETLPFRMVWKKQKRWERPGDPASWRREYDLYQSEFGRHFSDELRWPACYGQVLTEEEHQSWLECIDGVSGSSLTCDHLEQAAEAWGRFQGRVSRESDQIRGLSCLGDAGFLRRENDQWHTQIYTYDFLVSEPSRLQGFLKERLRSGAIRLIDGKSFEYSCLRSPGCDLPAHLRDMLIAVDDARNDVFRRIERQPVVLCHRDFWTENIFWTEDGIRLIDWDTAGWGSVCEDIASLIVDGTKAGDIRTYCQRLIPAYRKGLSEYVDVSGLEEALIHDTILIKFGYRIFQDTLLTENTDDRREAVAVLQQLHDWV